MNTTKQISLGEIILDERLHARAGGVKTGHVEDFVLSYETGVEVELPRVWLLKGRPGYFLTRGHHRVAAAKKLEKKKIECEVRSGDLNDAILDAATGDLGHGLPRTKEDKERNIRMVLGVDPDLSDRAIAEKLHVRHQMVGEVRAQVVAATTSDAKSKGKTQTSTRRTGKDGKTYPASPSKPKAETPPLVPDPDEEVKALHKELKKAVADLPEGEEEAVREWEDAALLALNRLVRVLKVPR